jgi:minor extracellular serine protease Vpr
MRTHPRREPLRALPLALVAVAGAAALIAAGGHGGKAASTGSASNWQGLAGEQRPRVAVGQRMIVLLKAPALADRLALVGGLATTEQERRWTAAALTAQKLLISRLAVEGVVVQPEYVYTRVVNGFSAAFDANGLALLERAPEVAGVFPVRAAYPATVPSAAEDLAPQLEHPTELGLSGIDGRGVTVALLDTGVDRSQRSLRGRVTNGIDVVGGSKGAVAAANPDAPAELERHGTELAGIVVGSGGPGGMAGIAPGATVLPIRVGGWQRDASGQWSVFGRTDQLLEGLEHAVDPNGDGDAHDAARVALVGLSEPFAAFADGPLARAAQGALQLDTLVVAPAGNDGPAGPSYGSISGPGGAPAALTVGAADLRTRFAQARLVVRAGLSVEWDHVVALGGERAAHTSVNATLAVPRSSPQGAPRAAVPLVDFYDRSGRDLVAGRVALVPLGADPATTVANAARAGAVAVLFYGGNLPGGALGVDPSAAIPAASVPGAVARAWLHHVRGRVPLNVSLGAPSSMPNSVGGGVAPFSSTGLAFDGRVKPDVVAPGVGLGTAEPGLTEGGRAMYGTVNGTSAAAAVVAGGAALLAQARPELDAESLKGVLVGSARPLGNDALAAQGAGLLDLGGAAATELTLRPTSLALGRATDARWHVLQQLQLRNVSMRRLRVSFETNGVRSGAAGVAITIRPASFSIGAGQTTTIHLRAHLTSAPDGIAPTEGIIVVKPQSGREIHVPWAVTFGPRLIPLLADVRLSDHSFRPSDTRPTLLTFVAGSVPRVDGSQEVRPLSRLDLELWSSSGGRIGVLATMRDVLPGRYSYGVTGRDPTGQLLPSGPYTLRLVGYPTDDGAPTVRTVSFAIK